MLLNLLIIPYVLTATTEQWRSRAIYQILTDRFSKGEVDDPQPCEDLSKYCGGTWKGITSKLQYVKDLGFDAIWISPIVKNAAHGYHGYWTTDFEAINEEFGTEDDLHELVTAAHVLDIYVMVDVVANHVAYVPWKDKMDDFSGINPFNDATHYHKKCEIEDWTDPWQMENCRLCGLPDLAQENEYVRLYLLMWIQNLVQKFGFDGIRIDTLGHVPKEFWKQFGEASGVFQMGEVLKSEAEIVGPYQKYVTSVFNFPMYHAIKDVFGKKDPMIKIHEMFMREEKLFENVDILGLFVDNHDMARFLSEYDDPIAFESALIFSLTARGIPFFYYGSEHLYNGGNDPKNRESMWQDFGKSPNLSEKIKLVNENRKKYEIWNKVFIERKVTDSLYAFSRGQFLVLLTNQKSAVSARISYLPFSENDVICNIFDGKDCLQVKNGGIQVRMENGEAKIYVLQYDEKTEKIEKWLKQMVAEREVNGPEHNICFK